MRLKLSFLTTTTFVAFVLPASSGEPIIPGFLSDPAIQPFLVEHVANALDPSFVIDTTGYDCTTNPLVMQVGENVQFTGLLQDGGEMTQTRIYGYQSEAAAMDAEEDLYSWPGPTIEARSGVPLCVTWENDLEPDQHYLIQGVVDGSQDVPVVDTSLHWAYSLVTDEVDYTEFSIFDDGVPIVTHLHGGNSEFASDGNPEFFFTKDFAIKGPQWVKETYEYANSQQAAMLWYHDHALGLTRLNVYAGMAGFYVLRDNKDSGRLNNPLKLPAGDQELAFAIQDRSFGVHGELYYPAFQDGHPAYEDFIEDELPCEPFCTLGGPTALAEFFGDHMVVNGAIWPKYDIAKADWYRIRLLNGCDSRFLVINFIVVPAGEIDATGGVPLPYRIVGTDQGLVWEGAEVERNLDELNPEPLVIAPGNRYDIIIDFNGYEGQRIIVTNEGGDEPFGGLPVPNESFLFERTNTIMAFDVDPNAIQRRNNAKQPKWRKINQVGQSHRKTYSETARVRRVALFEGNDEYGRLQPLLGPAQPATDFEGNPINWPDDSGGCDSDCEGLCAIEECDDPADCDSQDCSACPYFCAGLTGQIEGTVAWHSPTTENPALDSDEEWEIWNVSADAHPIHLHLVNFEVISRHDIIYDGALGPVDDDFDSVLESPDDAFGDGVYVVEQPIVQHNGKLGSGRRIVFPADGGCLDDRCYHATPTDVGNAYVENGPMDVVTALPNQVTKIKARFDRPGRYVWHCHILSHEDHEMMRVLHVGPGA